MTEGTPSASLLEDLLRRLEEARQALVDSLEACDPERFALEDTQGESVKRVLERTADDLIFYYGRLVAQAVSQSQPPRLQKAEFGSLWEATASLQVAHRRLSHLLHDLLPADLGRTVADEEHGNYTLRELLEMTTTYYVEQAQQVSRLLAQMSGDGR